MNISRRREYIQAVKRGDLGFTIREFKGWLRHHPDAAGGHLIDQSHLIEKGSPVFVIEGNEEGIWFAAVLLLGPCGPFWLRDLNISQLIKFESEDP